ncbi:MAG: dihydroneopterin aldolase [Candidatus Riflebacteria bacterium]|nr:dihydroneopterin aldolase [Candidatus Riflebacteria bacterium]
MDRIVIRGLCCRCIIGINEDERREKQDVTINLSIYSDFGKPCRSDNFSDAIDYRSLKKRVLAMVENSEFFLIEALAEAIADICLATTGVQKIRVGIDKPSALRFAKSVGVIIFRKRNS